MKIAVIAITKNGVTIACKIKQEMGCDVYIPDRFRLGMKDCSELYTIEGNFIEFVHSVFCKYQGLVFIAATGIAVRAIAGAVKDKREDPAVVVADEGGRFAISLLSGHLGGANSLAQKVAKILGAMPVVTTASDISGFEGIDVVSKELGLYIDNFKDLKHVSAAIVNGEKVAFITRDDYSAKEMRQRFENPHIVFCDEIPADGKGAVFVTDYNVDCPSMPHVVLRPQNIVIGVGSRRGAAFSALEDTLVKALSEKNLSPKSIRCIGTIDLKKDEKCILELAEELQVPIKYYTADELKAVEGNFPVSSFVKQTVGVGSVARPSGFLASRRGKESGYYKENGITLSIYKRGIL